MSRSNESAELAAKRARVDAFYAQQDADKVYLHNNIKEHQVILKRDADIKRAAAAKLRAEQKALLRQEQAKIPCNSEMLQPGNCQYGKHCFFLH